MWAPAQSVLAETSEPTKRVQQELVHIWDGEAAQAPANLSLGATAADTGIQIRAYPCLPGLLSVDEGNRLAAGHSVFNL